jgi:hypothetical protein
MITDVWSWCCWWWWGAGEPVDPDPIVPTVGANWRGLTPAMLMLEGFWSMKRMWDPANSTAVDKRQGAHEFYPGSRPLGRGSLHPPSNLVYDIVVLQGAAVGGIVCLICLRSPSRGCPWWLYLCSQFGFTRFLAFYSKSMCWALRASCISFERASSLAGTR